VFAYSDVSGSHAQLIEKENGDIVIVDSGSTNGTYVNGQKTSMHILKPGDTVMLANKHPFDWINVFPRQEASKNNAAAKTNKTKILLMAAAVMAALAAVFLFVQKPWEAQRPALVSAEKPLSPEEIYARYKKSVVLISGAYYYEASANGKTLGYYSLDDEGEVVRINPDDDAIFYTGTGFIVSSDGKIVTNKHIAAPWEYHDDVITEIKKSAQKRTSGEVRVEGKLAFIGCFLNDTYVSGVGDLIPCIPVKTGAAKDLDVAVLQTNSKTTPPGTETIIDLNQAVITDDGIVAGASIFTIGFPAGLGLGLTDQGIQANNQDGKITQMRGDIEFGHNIAIIGGASGSPVFNEYGRLIGIINAGYKYGQGYNLAVKAKYAVELVK
jgi:hypothetical protein